MAPRDPPAARRDQRRFPRLRLNLQVAVSHPGFGRRVFSTRDISDGGIFLACDAVSFPPVGAVVQVQVQGMAEAAPVRRMAVVRFEDDGVALRFVDEESG